VIEPAFPVDPLVYRPPYDRRGQDVTDHAFDAHHSGDLDATHGAAIRWLTSALGVEHGVRGDRVRAAIVVPDLYDLGIEFGQVRVTFVGERGHRLEV